MGFVYRFSGGPSGLGDYGSNMQYEPMLAEVLKTAEHDFAAAEKTWSQAYSLAMNDQQVLASGQQPALLARFQATLAILKKHEADANRAMPDSNLAQKQWDAGQKQLQAQIAKDNEADRASADREACMVAARQKYGISAELFGPMLCDAQLWWGKNAKYVKWGGAAVVALVLYPYAKPFLGPVVKGVKSLLGVGK